MSGYSDFAEAYDALTFNVPYDEISEYYLKIIGELIGDTHGKRLLDQGCGTGNLTIRLACGGFDIVEAQDASGEMLAYARRKTASQHDCPVVWVERSMTDEIPLALDVRYDAAVSTLDSIDHLDGAAEMKLCFEQTARALKSGGAFVFDVNTVYKHREILGNNTFIYDVDGVYCVWQNEFSEADNGVDITLDLFFEEVDENGDAFYSRGFEQFRETALTESEYRLLLEEAGFEVVRVYEYMTFDAPCEKSEKLLFAAVKK